MDQRKDQKWAKITKKRLKKAQNSDKWPNLAKNGPKSRENGPK